jgi:hypothetical protein
MRKLFLSFILAGMVCCVSAQDNMEAFSHLSVGAEVGLHGYGVEVALPIQKHFVLKAGYNWMPSGDLFNTDIKIDTRDLREAQENIENAHLHTFQNKFGDEAVISAGLHMGLTNYKVMINWYPFASGRFYFAGGAYYTPDNKKDDPFIRLSGHTTENDWNALKELNQVEKQINPLAPEREIALKIGNESYPVQEVDGQGFMAAEFKTDPLKYYVGVGVGRCIPNRFIGMQLEMGALIYHNAVLRCQDKEVGSITDAADSFGNDTKEILEYIDKYPIYPQVTLRLSFRLF